MQVKEAGVEEAKVTKQRILRLQRSRESYKRIQTFVTSVVIFIISMLKGATYPTAFVSTYAGTVEILPMWYITAHYRSGVSKKYRTCTQYSYSE